jgi:hypothetical protein
MSDGKTLEQLEQEGQIEKNLHLNDEPQKKYLGFIEFMNKTEKRQSDENSIGT